MREKKTLAEEACKRYRKAGKQEKTAILNELVEYLGCNRKYLIHKLAALGKTSTVQLDGKAAKLAHGNGKKEDEESRYARKSLAKRSECSGYSSGTDAVGLKSANPRPVHQGAEQAPSEIIRHYA